MESDILKPLATNQVGVDILKALGFAEKRVKSLAIHFEPLTDVVVKVECWVEEKEGESLAGEFAKIGKTYHLVERKTEPDPES